MTLLQKVIEMKILFGSDLHLEFCKNESHIPEVPECDLLLLCGDIFCPWNMSSFDKQIFQEFMSRCSKNAKQTLMVLGNHEHYNGYFVETANKVREMIADYQNIKLLDCEFFQYGDVFIFGATFWTDIRGGHPEVVWDIQRGMTDYTCIQFSEDRYNPYNLPVVKLRAEDTMNENHYARGKLRNFMTIAEERNLKPLVMTHMAPSYDSCTEACYKHNNLSYAYANTGLDDYLFDFPKHTWVYGHMHSRAEGEVGNCSWKRNPRGYIGYENHQTISEFKFKEIVL